MLSVSALIHLYPSYLSVLHVVNDMLRFMILWNPGNAKRWCRALHLRDRYSAVGLHCVTNIYTYLIIVVIHASFLCRVTEMDMNYMADIQIKSSGLGLRSNINMFLIVESVN